MHRTNPSNWYDPGPNQHHWSASSIPVFGGAGAAAAVSSDQPRGLGTPIYQDLMNINHDLDDMSQDSRFYDFTRSLGEVGEDVPLDTVETQALDLQPGYTNNATTTTTTNSTAARSIQAPQEIHLGGGGGCERGCVLCVPKPNMTWGYLPTGPALPPVPWLPGLPGEYQQQQQYQPRGATAADTAEGGSGGGGYCHYSPHDAVAAAFPTPSPTPTLGGDWMQPAGGGGGGGHGGTGPVAQQQQQQQQDRSGRKPRDLATALHSCVPCRKTFGSRRDAQRHEKTVHMGETINCPGCGKTFKGRKDNLKRHREKYCSQGKQLG